MVKNDASATQRRHRRYIVHILPLLCVAFVCVGLFFFLRVFFSPAPFRQTIVVVADPVHVVSFDGKHRNITTIDIPLDTVIPAAFGYGTYTMRALISLDEIDHHNGALIVGSVSNALGLPISGYVRLDGRVDGPMTRDLLRQMFSYRSVFDVGMNRMHRSVSWSMWVRFVGSVGNMSVDAWHPISILQAIVDMSSPDGGLVPTLDESRLDYIIDTSFFDSGIRSEGTSVAVYNTTTVPSVGLRASRQMARVGMQLIYVGNAETAVKRCVIAGSLFFQKTKTAQFMRSYYGCDMKEDESLGKETGADLVVLLGTDFASQYK